MSKILITGGAGYIGSHAVFKACELGYEVVIIDNLFRGFKECIDVMTHKFPNKITFYKADLRNKSEIREILLKENEIEGVLHFAALCLVNESMENPYLYFENNVYGTANILDIMKELNINNIVFSSTCATYASLSSLGNEFSVNENNPQNPESPYGESKYLAEREIFWFQKLFGINYTVFRYFNVCGAQKDGIIGDSKKPSQLLMQNAVRGALGIEPFKFTFGQVDTLDGSPIRDYINVEDLVDVHFLALDRMKKENKSGIYNIGTGKGNSVKEIVDKVMQVTGKNFEVTEGESRKGEAKALYADTTKVRNELGWEAKRSIEDSINSLVNWYSGHPNGWNY